jgi:hypothetical protein
MAIATRRPTGRVLSSWQNFEPGPTLIFAKVKWDQANPPPPIAFAKASAVRRLRRTRKRTGVTSLLFHRKVSKIWSELADVNFSRYKKRATLASRPL